MSKIHSYHIPVMGIGFTADTPLRVAHLGIDSVISLVDDILLEKLRKFHSSVHDLSYEEISKTVDDFRAKRITSYLNLIHDLVQNKFEELKSASSEMSDELKKYFHLLPDNSSFKQEFKSLSDKYLNWEEIFEKIKSKLELGSIDVNIMTKVDKDNFKNGEKLPVEYNDAHAALRGYAKSKLSSSVVLSAGMNPRLYSYIEEFDDFYPDKNGNINKKIILKVSDYRSALIQGKFLAKKGIWISEYRIESGLNCGGHAFATDGYLMGPILEEFKNNREELKNTLFEILTSALEKKGRVIPNSLKISLTAQGGVGTTEEHNFLLEHYGVDSIGWGTPFLLVPEVTNVDRPTLKLLEDSKEEDLYLSGISPLGVPFNSLRGNSKEEEKQNLIEKGRPGSSCPKKFVTLNYEYDEKGLCTASRQFQHYKIKELELLDLSQEEYQNRFDKIVEKSCTCVGLGTSALLVNNLDTRVEGEGVSICPGPNMAYFSKEMSLTELNDHIYGRHDVIDRSDRPNFFIKELGVYIDYLRNKLDEVEDNLDRKQEKYFRNFISNLNNGIQYYVTLFEKLKNYFNSTKEESIRILNEQLDYLNEVRLKVEDLSAVKSL